MLDTLIELAKSNQMLAAGLGTVAFSSGMYMLRAVPRRMFGGAKRLMSIELKLTSRSPLYHEILATLSAHRIRAFARCYTTSYNDGLVAGYGQSVAFYRGKFVLFDRHLTEDKMRQDETLTVRIMSRDVGVAQALLADASAPPPDHSLKVYPSSGFSSYWGSGVKKRKRSLDTIFTNGDQKELIVERIRWFLANEDWYLCRGIPYKQVFLLHGVPGTGKTSLIYGIASHFGRDLCTVTNLTNVDELLRTMPSNTFAVFEDIDLISTARPQGDQVAPAPGQPTPIAPSALSEMLGESPLSALQKLMQTLDGLATPHGLVVFITTNHRDRLEPALIRPGRVDHDLEIGPIGPDAVRAMFIAYYGEEHAELIEPYVRGQSFRARPGAEVQQVFIEESAPASAVHRLAHCHTSSPGLSQDDGRIVTWEGHHGEKEEQGQREGRPAP
jgi:chaperone BCS1